MVWNFYDSCHFALKINFHNKSFLYIFMELLLLSTHVSLSALCCSGQGIQDVYFEKIRVFKAGDCLTSSSTYKPCIFWIFVIQEWFMKITKFLDHRNLEPYSIIAKLWFILRIYISNIMSKHVVYLRDMWHCCVMQLAVVDESNLPSHACSNCTIWNDVKK